MTALARFDGLADFVSLGRNDLTQYALGRELSWEPYLSEYSPSVLGLIALALDSARRLGMPAGSAATWPPIPTAPSSWRVPGRHR